MHSRIFEIQTEEFDLEKLKENDEDTLLEQLKGYIDADYVSEDAQLKEDLLWFTETFFGDADDMKVSMLFRKRRLQGHDVYELVNKHIVLEAMKARLVESMKCVERMSHSIQEKLEKDESFFQEIYSLRHAAHEKYGFYYLIDENMCEEDYFYSLLQIKEPIYFVRSWDYHC